METLAARVERTGPLDPSAAVSLVARLALAVEHAHERAEVHGAIGPESLVLGRDDASGILRSSAKCAPAFHYQTRERIGGGAPSAADDAWALGGILYFALTGSAPFPGENPSEVAARIALGTVSPLAVFDAGDDDLQDLIEHVFSGTTEQRLSTASEIAASLGRWLEKRGIAVGPALEINQGGSVDLSALPPPPELPDTEDRPTIPRSDVQFTFANEETTVPHEAQASTEPTHSDADRSLAEKLPSTSELIARAKAAPSKSPPPNDPPVPSPNELAARLRKPSMPPMPRLNPPKALERSKARSERPPPVGRAAPPGSLPRIAPLPPPPSALGAYSGSGSAPLPPPPARSQPVVPPPPLATPSVPPPSTEIAELAALLEPEEAKLAPTEASNEPASLETEVPSKAVASDGTQATDSSSASDSSEQTRKKGRSSKTNEASRAARASKPDVASKAAAGSKSSRKSDSGATTPPSAVPGLPPPTARAARSRKSGAALESAAAESRKLTTRRAKSTSSRLSSRWAVVVVLAAIAAGAAIGVKLFSSDEPPRPDTPSSVPVAARTSVTPSSVSASTAIPSTTVPLPESAPPLPSASAVPEESARAPARSAPSAPADVASCMTRLFAADSFKEGSPPELSFVCEETDPRAGSQRVHEALVVAGMKRTVSEGMREWAVMGWYELATYAALRGRCCPDAAPIELPPPPGACTSLADALNDIAKHAHARATPIEQKTALKGFRKSLSCMLKSGKSKPFGTHPKPGGGEDTAFMKTYERARQP